MTLAIEAPAVPEPDDELTAAELAQLRAEFDQGKGCQHCVLPGTHIGMSVPRPVETVSAGSLVLGDDGRTHRVTATAIHQHSGPIRTIHARSVLPLSVTGDHQFLVFPQIFDKPSRSGWKWRQTGAPSDERPIWRRADDLKPGDYLVSPIPNFDGPLPPLRWQDPEMGWLLGVLAGNGYTAGRDGKRYYVGAVMSRHVERTVAAMENLGLRVNVKSTPKYTRMLACSREVAEEVTSIIGSLSPIKHLPDFAWSSKDYLTATLDGLMAADGNYTDRGKRGREHHISTTSIAMAWQVWQAALALGEKPYLGVVNRRSGYPNAKPIWKLSWSVSSSQGHTVRHRDMYVMPIKKIETTAYDGPVHDLTVSGTPTFTANGILTHNCGGRHARACPRVKRLKFHPTGALAEVAFWPDGEWSDDHVIWPEDLTNE